MTNPEELKALKLAYGRIFNENAALLGRIDELEVHIQQPELEPESPIRLSDEQEAAVKLWGADDRLWTTQETVEFNLRTFARVVLATRHVPVGTEEKK